MKNFLKKVKEKSFASPIISGVFLAPYYTIRTSTIATNLLDRKSIRLMEAHPPVFGSAETRIVNDISKHGIAFSSLDELFPGQNLLLQLQETAKRFEGEARVGRKKSFLMYLWDISSAIDFENPFIKLSLDPKVLSLATGYLGRWPKFKFFSLNKTIPQSAESAAAGSQRWHRDPGVRRLFKMFIYLNDITDLGAGPFIYVKGSQHGGERGGLFPKRLSGREGCYPPDGAVERAVPKESIQPGTGKAGSVIFCDTLGIHKGGYSTTKERIMFTALYEAPAAFGRSKLKYPEHAEGSVKALPEQARFALR